MPGDSWQFGHANSMVQLAHAIDGQVRPEPFTVVERAGCELSPVDAATAQGRPLLRTRLWNRDADIPRQRLLGTAHYHGVPVRLAGS